MFSTGCIFLTILSGLFIPLNFIAASPQEYVNVAYFHHPLLYAAHSLCYAAGTFMIWFGVFYSLAAPTWKSAFDRLIWIACGVFIADYMFFGTDLGVISSMLCYENDLTFPRREILINLAVVLCLFVAMLALYRLLAKKNLAPVVLGAAIFALLVMSGRNVYITKSAVDRKIADEEADSGIPSLTLSTGGKNVVVIMLDRCLGDYVPYLMEEKPVLQTQFDGFTYYPNTVSHGAITNIGSPPLLGGYEYTPVEMNKRNTEYLREKHNEALLTMPVLFSKNGYKVTVGDPPYANYQWIPDLSIYNDYPEIKAYISEDRFADQRYLEQEISDNNRNFFCFSLMKTMPLFIQPVLYADGSYNRGVMTTDATYGYDSMAPDTYNALKSLPAITNIVRGDDNTYLFFANNLTHDGAKFQMPDYTPSDDPDNTEYYEAHKKRYSMLDDEIFLELNPDNIKFYNSQMAAFMLLGDWFDYLREKGVYDNTRIIIASDHGHIMRPLNAPEDPYDTKYFFPLLMVKDFGCTGLNVSDEFMTNADVPFLSVDGLIEDPKNPFTGKLITDTEKTAHDQYLSRSIAVDVEVNNGTTFLPGTWCRVHDDIWDSSNWEFYNEKTVLAEYAFPAE